MAENDQWYYVENHDRKGPVAFAELKRLAAQGIISEQTLVWKEGMQDWQNAQSIKGLIEKKSAGLPTINTGGKPKKGGKTTERFQSGEAPSITPRQTTTQKPAAQPVPSPVATASPTVSVATSPTVSVATSPTVSVATNPPVSVATNPQAPNPAVTAASLNLQMEQAGDPGRRHHSGRTVFDMLKFAGYPCLIAGFMLVIMAKGCDSLGNRWASRLKANSQLVESKFNNKYLKKKNAYQLQIDQLRESDNPDLKNISDLTSRMSDLTKEQLKERQELERTTWFDMRTSASMAQQNNLAWGFYRELIFVFGSMALAIGLLIVGGTGNSSEKWICMIMLAIITFSLYIGGFAWVSSLAGLNVGF